MKLRTYLTKNIIFFFLLTIMTALYFDFYIVSFILVCFFSVLIFLYRENNVRITYDNVMSLPVNGYISSLKYAGDKVTIQIIISPVKSFGIYAPFKAEVRSVHYDKNKKRNFIRYSQLKNKDYQRLEIIFKTVEGVKVKMMVYPDYFSFIPKFQIDSGDVCQSGSNIAHLPFGGRIELELPESKVLVSENDSVLVGETVLVGEYGK